MTVTFTTIARQTPKDGVAKRPQAGTVSKSLRTLGLAGLLSASMIALASISVPAYAGLNDQYPVGRTATGSVSDQGAYTVAKGDTLYGISRRFNVSVVDIKQLNGLKSNAIGQGKTLFIPGLSLGGGTPGNFQPVPTSSTSPAGNALSRIQEHTGDTYVVQKGDTLYRISITLNVPVTDLVQANNMQKADRIYIGQTLKVPNRTTAYGAETLAASNLPKVGSLSGSKSGTTSLTLSPTPAVAGARPIGDLGQRLTVPKPLVKPASVRSPDGVARPAVSSNTQTAAVRLDPLPQPSSLEATSNVKLNWPLRGQLLDTFGLKQDGVKVDGITIAAAAGTEVHAAGDGLVMYAGDALSDFGRLLLIKHDSGLITAYAHNDSIVVKKGDRVKGGQKIATVGQTGDATRPQLHFQVRQDGKPVDPLKFLSR